MATHEAAATPEGSCSQPTKTTPKEALVMAAILKEMGVNEFEPRIINQMVEFAYRYVTDTVEDARVYASHANRKTINIEDIKLSVSQKLDHSFTSPPPREFLLDIARSKNALPLPMISDRSGIRLPPERYCLTSNNYKVKSTNKKAQPQKRQSTTGVNKVNSKVSSIPGNINTQRMGNPQAPTFQSTLPRTQPSQTLPMNKLQSNSNPAQAPSMISSMLKRKHEDDYDT